MKIILIRHGESEGNVKYGYISGRSDPAGLTIQGRTQIMRSAWDLRSEHIDEFHVSPVVRAQESANILNSYLKLPLKTIEWLTELDHGIFEGAHWWEVIHKIPADWRKQRENYKTALPEGESMESLVHRVWEGLQKHILPLEQNKTILILSHQAVITSIRYCLLHGDPSTITTHEEERRFVQFMKDVQLPNAGYVKIELDESRKVIHVDERKEFDKIKPDLDGAYFYAQGILQDNRPLTISYLESASSNEVFKVEHGETHILKVLHGTSHEAAKRQVALYGYLKQKGIPAPQIESFDAGHCFFQDDVFIQDYIAGADITCCMENHPETLKVLLSEVYETCEKIHALPRTEVLTFWIPPVEKPFLQWKVFMQYNINMTLHTLMGTDLSTEIKDFLYSTLSELRRSILKEEHTLVPIHGDLAMGNIIATHIDSVCRLQRLIDFEWARMGDAMWDYAYYLGFLEREHVGIARQWEDILLRARSIEDMRRVMDYRLLFHAWSVRDMHEYADHPIRGLRGKKSKDILHAIFEKEKSKKNTI